VRSVSARPVALKLDLPRATEIGLYAVRRGVIR
jgi:hypothetical protein